MSVHIATQPNTANLANAFPVVEGENVYKIYKCQEGCSGCCGPQTTVVLTDKRLISRREVPNGLCGMKSQTDSTVFLEDIQFMTQASQAGSSGCLTLLLACLTCTLPCFLCGMCCGDKPKSLTVAIGHGYENFFIKGEQFNAAAVDITTAIMAAKRNKDRY